MDIPYRRLVEVWFDAQVELHGQYSLARLNSFHAYAQQTPMWRVVFVTLLTPAIAILLITLTDAIPLQDPLRGLSESHFFWIRAFITICAVSGGALFQLRIIVPKLEMSYTEAIGLTLVSSAAAVATQYGWAVAIGYPVPFGLVLGTPSCFWVIVGGVTIPRRERLRTRPELRRQLKNYLIILICQINMTVVYPVYNYVFIQLSSTAQTAFVMLLPLIKLANKNWLSHLLQELDDLRPELVVFNVEVFHALYVSICMQSSTSIYTTITIMAIDFIQAWLSLRDLNDILNGMEDVLMKIPLTGHQVSSPMSTPTPNDQASSSVASKNRRRNIVEAAAAALDEDNAIRTRAGLRQSCFVSNILSQRTSSIVGTTGSGVGPRLSVVQRFRDAGKDYQAPQLRSSTVSIAQKMPSTATIHPICRDDSSAPHVALGSELPLATSDSAPPVPTQGIGLDADERLRLVQKTLQVLFFTEFVVLVEYAEVLIPLIYNACTIGMIRLPNRAFYPQLAAKSEDELKQTFGNVAFYGALEYVSFAAFCMLLRRRLHFSVLTQVAFVLEKQFEMVQAKLMMWVFYVIQTSLRHFGADFSFSFQWLTTST